MEELLNDFLNKPDGAGYDALSIALERRGAEKVLSTLPADQRNLLLKKGVEALEDPDMFYRWLWNAPRFQGAKPIDLILAGKTSEVLDMLGRIEHSIYS